MAATCDQCFGPTELGAQLCASCAALPPPPPLPEGWERPTDKSMTINDLPPELETAKREVI